ncbi:Ldh family oxidoreductase [Rhodospirillaceae bacterium KN72]|uniref:Ldh family oxidoreductase n=1 Tax=Pacificispira spongiicola TaxID=2729598 RepID=A0A7Y0E2K2_9PROT|nr:Ldh family oxidoreductase [Pacificispira spongiicola]NMM46016.1 Ldh family oxidoreductase [Pacificispira spongiicola]
MSVQKTATDTTSSVSLTLDEARDLAIAALTRRGADNRNARAVADIMIRAERDRCASHGLFRLQGYCASLDSGKVDGAAHPTLHDMAPGVLKVDGKGGFAPLALELGLPALADRARQQGVAVLGLTDIYHFAALWPEVETLGELGLCGLAMTQASPMVAPAGGTKPFFGTNPLAFSWPRPGQDPFVFDQATAALARGEIMIMARDGHDAPDGAGIDPDGNPTNDPAKILEGAQLPFGGYKGSNIALMIELLAGALIGSVFSVESGRQDNKDGGPPVGGEFILAMDPSRFGDAGWAAHTEVLFKELEAIGVSRLPGTRRRLARQETPSQGIRLPKALYDTVQDLAVGNDTDGD